MATFKCSKCKFFCLFLFVFFQAYAWTFHEWKKVFSWSTRTISSWSVRTERRISKHCTWTAPACWLHRQLCIEGAALHNFVHFHTLITKEIKKCFFLNLSPISLSSERHSSGDEFAWPTYWSREEVRSGYARLAHCWKEANATTSLQTPRYARRRLVATQRLSRHAPTTATSSCPLISARCMHTHTHTRAHPCWVHNLVLRE